MYSTLSAALQARQGELLQKLITHVVGIQVRWQWWHAINATKYQRGCFARVYLPQFTGGRMHACCCLHVGQPCMYARRMVGSILQKCQTVSSAACHAFAKALQWRACSLGMTALRPSSSLAAPHSMASIIVFKRSTPKKCSSIMRGGHMA